MRYQERPKASKKPGNLDSGRNARAASSSKGSKGSKSNHQGRIRDTALAFLLARHDGHKQRPLRETGLRAIKSRCTACVESCESDQTQTNCFPFWP